ncbi:BON domain-containing protein [candidate division KSB1 bacterium]|nr:BON domain-containing protein [candidate division KSB1 bacterium]
MKTIHSYLDAAFIAALLLFSMAQSLHATPERMQIKQKVEKIVNLYCPQDLSIKVTDDGLVQIKGTVPVLYDRLRAFDIISKVQRVRKIENEIVVQTPVIPDKIIEAGIVEKLGINQAISDPGRIDVTVNNGVVTLEGVTRTLWTEDQMVEELSGILGVQKVISNLKLSI